MTSVQTISGWFERGVAKKADFMIVVCDSFDYSNFPVFCSRAEYAKVYRQEKNASMQRIMEVYDLSADEEDQLSEVRCHNGPVGESDET